MLGNTVEAFECFLIHTAVPCHLFAYVMLCKICPQQPCLRPAPVPHAQPFTPVASELFILPTFTDPVLKSLTLIQGILTALAPTQIIFPNLQFLPKFLPVQFKCRICYSWRQSSGISTDTSNCSPLSPLLASFSQ